MSKDTLFNILKAVKKHYVLLGGILLLTFLLRLPSLFEPFWYGDEGIFAAVAQNLNQGGVLYQTAWDNKPPLIYLTYQAIFGIFGVSMFWLRMVTLVVVLITAVLIYEIGCQILTRKRALVATLIFGFLTSLRVIEGNLALTEIFMILPISGAMLLAIKRNFDEAALFGSGLLLAIASLYKQVGILEAAALGIFLFLISKNFGEFFKKGIFLAGGFAIPVVLVVFYFASKNLLGDFIFASYTYYQIYLGESPRHAALVNVFKYVPIVAAIFYGLLLKKQKRVGQFHLLWLWSALAFLGSYFSGRAYGHYLVQAVPALALLAAAAAVPLRLDKVKIAFALGFFLPLLVLTKVLFTDFLTAGNIDQIAWWRNFVDMSLGNKSVDAYNNYFDGNVNSIMALADFFRSQDGTGTTAYIWGDYPWLYAISDLQNPVRYVTSFHVFGVPEGKEEVIGNLTDKAPDFIIKPPVTIGHFEQLERLLAANYTLLFKVNGSQVFVKEQEEGQR